MLLRQVIEDETLSGEALPYNTQVLIPNTLHRRDRETYPLADTFAPETWANGSPHPLFNHFGGGAQACAGRELALFLAKAVLTNLLTSGHYTLERPPLDPRARVRCHVPIIISRCISVSSPYRESSAALTTYQIPVG